MKTDELLEQVFSDGVFVSTDGPNLKISGDKIAVGKWIEELKLQKKEIVRLLSGDHSEVDHVTPSICRGCPQSEVIVVDEKVAIPGCVQRLDAGPWAEEWKRLPEDLKKCIVH